MRTGYAVLGVAILLVLAGCNAWQDTPTATTEHPTSSPSPTERPPDPTVSTATDEPVIVVRGGSLPVDPYIVWQRTQQLLGTNVTPPDRVVVSHSGTQSYSNSRFYRQFTACPDVTFTPNDGAHVDSPDAISLYIDSNTSAAAIQKLLVHEYTHVVQYRTRVPRNLSVDVLGPVLQGAAIYTADAYARTYLDDTTLQSTESITLYRDASPCKRTIFAQNYFGYRYVANRVDSPRDLQAVYADPPRTSEQVLHNLSPDAEPPRPLSVEVEQAAAGEWLLVDNRTQGELAVRSVLWTHLSPARAERAATGWGNDRLLRFENGPADGYVWVLRWDDPANATEFTDALGTYFDRRATRTETGWADGATRFAVERTGDETAVVVAGNETFVRSVNVTETNGTVSVSVGSEPG